LEDYLPVIVRHLPISEQYLPRQNFPDYLDRDDLHFLGVDSRTIARILRESQLTGHGRKKVVEAGHLDDLLRSAGKGGK
jgi:hypothetical protein